MRGKSLGFVLIALGTGIVLALVLPAWLLVLLIGLGMIALGIILCK